MEQEILCLGWSGYNFKQDGETIKGAKLSYISDYSVNEDLKKGYLPTKVSFSMEQLKGIDFPCLAIGKFIFIPDSKGNPVVTLVSITPKKKVDVSILFK
ncbi:MAG: hypothetical protein ACLRRH_11425 [Clostridium sp.]